MRDIFSDLNAPLSDPDPVRRAQIQMKAPLPKRFYTEVAVGPADGGYTILLDGKPVRTPTRNALVVPTRGAAELMAAEWAAQVEIIDPLKMPVTRLANSAIDGVSQQLDAVFDDIVKYAGTDLLCYRAEAPQSLVEAQSLAWDPVLFWAAETLGARFILVEGIIHQAQPPQAIEAYRTTLARHRDPFKLASLHTITTLTGSALLSLAFAEGFYSDEQVWMAAHIDEDWQIGQWGTDAEAEARRAARWLDMKAASALFHAVNQPSDQ